MSFVTRLAFGLVAIALTTRCALPPPTPESAAFGAANIQLSSPHGADAFGNTEDARRRAAKFRSLLETMRELAFTKSSRQELIPSDSRFVAHCEMRQGHVTFLVHVPELRHLRRDASAQLLDVAWAAALSTISDLPREQLQLAVGLRGEFLYGEIGIGPASASAPARRDGTSIADLKPFFGGPALAPAPKAPLRVGASG